MREKFGKGGRRLFWRLEYRVHYLGRWTGIGRGSEDEEGRVRHGIGRWNVWVGCLVTVSFVGGGLFVERIFETRVEDEDWCFVGVPVCSHGRLMVSLLCEHIYPGA